MKTPTRTHRHLIETDGFQFEFLSRIATRESWRKEIHRPIYHIHKWWAKRLGSVFRGILLGCVLDPDADLREEFYRRHTLSGVTVLDPFMGSGTTIGEAHKLGFTALGRDINPVAVNSVRVALGPLDEANLKKAFNTVSTRVGDDIRVLYRSHDSNGQECDVLYYFWVMRTNCSCCGKSVDLFPSWIVARNAYPDRKPIVQVLCPACGDIFSSSSPNAGTASCPSCRTEFDATKGNAHGTKAMCPECRSQFTIMNAIGGRRPEFRLYAKLIINASGEKQYLPCVEADLERYEECRCQLVDKITSHEIDVPDLGLSEGYNTRQAMSYGFLKWRDFFNDRQLLALGLLRREILNISDDAAREAFLTLFSGILEFNNVFASYKGEGTGAVRHMFSHHILKPERTPIEANVWGTPKSSGSFSGLFRSRLLRAAAYQKSPSEVNGLSGVARVSSPPFSGRVSDWPQGPISNARTIYVSRGDSSALGLADNSIDLVVTDPPFFDNVHYSELADFFYAWQQLGQRVDDVSTRSCAEVQDVDSDRFASKLSDVFRECHRVLTRDGMMVFTYHHSREEGWAAVIDAVIRSGFQVVNAHPVKSELSVATPKSQAKEPIQVDIVIICRKASAQVDSPTANAAVESGKQKLRRLAGVLELSRNDRKVVLFGQLLTTVRSPSDFRAIARRVESELAALDADLQFADSAEGPVSQDPLGQLLLWAGDTGRLPASPPLA